MYKTKLFSGDKEIIASGSVISFENNPISIEILDDTESMVKLKFIFNDDDSITEQSMSTIVENDTLCLTLTNFNNPIGTGTTKPISFARYKGQLLHLHLRVTALNDTDRTLFYTIFADGGEDNGSK